MSSKKVAFLDIFYIYEYLKFHAQLSWAWKSFITSGPELYQTFTKQFYLSLQLGIAYTENLILKQGVKREELLQEKVRLNS